MVPLATYAAARPAPGAAASLLALAVYAVGTLVCHQRPERSFFLWGRQLPVCARCTGIYVGAALVSIGALLRPTNVSRSNAGNARRLVLISMLPLATTLIFEWTTGVVPGNWIRAATGILAGAAVAWVVSK